MPDRYDPKLSVRPAGDRKPPERAEGQGPEADDPLAELARIVSGRADPAVNSGRTEKPAVRVPPVSQPQPLPSEADLARDLESELLNELQASFSMIPEVVGRPAPPKPPPQQPAPAPQTAPPVAQTEMAVPPPVAAPTAPTASSDMIFRPMMDVPVEEDYGYRPPAGETHEPDQPPAAVPRTLQRQPGPPRHDQSVAESRVSPPPSAPKRESLAGRIARAAQGGDRAEAKSNPREQVDPPMSAAAPPVRSNNRRPPAADSRPEGEGAPFRPTLTPNYPENEPVAPPTRAAATRWDPAPEADSQPPIDASRFAPLRRDAPQGTGQEQSLEPDALAAELPYANVEDSYFDEAYGNQDQEMVPGYGDDELHGYSDEDMAALEPPRSRRGPLAIAVLLTVVVIAGAAFILFRSGADGPPPIITADTSPTKIAPDDAGVSDGEGQAKLIYDRVDPGAEIADSQLVVPGADPIANIPPIPKDTADSGVSRVILEGGPGTGASGDGTGRPSPSDSSQETRSSVARDDGQAAAQIGPKRVRTVVVRPDGTIVSSEAVAAPEDGETTLADIPPPSETPPAPAADENPLLSEDFGVEAIDNPVPAVPAENPASVSVPDIRPPTPAARPPARPAQPTIVATPGGSSGPIDLTPGVSAPTGRGGGFLVQVSSQRSEQVALASFNELQRRYPGILGDREPNIQRADLGERGVYFRVRVGYPTREQAVQMCESLKAAGGDCLLATR